MDLVNFQNENYPIFQTLGNASQFSIPFANYYCKGFGYDIGFCKEEWKFPNARGIDLSMNDGYNANNLPDQEVDYIYSSHCLEHVGNWIETLEYWISKLKSNGILFLYLPDFSQKYWRPWNNKKHKHCLTPEILKEFCKDHNMKNIFISGIDLNNSFIVVCQK
jgi:predicted SAM-dependent methyltransferase